MKPGRLILVLLLYFLAGPVGIGYGQYEATTDIQHNQGYEQSSGYYEQYEVRPDRSRRYIYDPEMRPAGILKLGPGAAQVRVRTRLQDSHMGIKFYNALSCKACHPRQALNNMHVYRDKLRCRQCHGQEPIASIQHYYSPMNPIRRHAYVCSKCHQGASASFASYVVHEPPPFSLAARKAFPALFYVFWIMAAIAVGTFALFLPHTFLWGLRELFVKKEKGSESTNKEQA